MKIPFRILFFVILWAFVCVIEIEAQQIAQLVTQAGSSPIVCVALSPDGRRFVVGRLDGVAILWDLQSKLEIHRLEGRTGEIWAVAFSPDGKALLTGSQDRSAMLWDVETGQIIRRFHGHEGAVHAVAFSPDGAFAVTGSEDRTARLWNVKTGNEVSRFIGHSDTVFAVAFSGNGSWLLTGSKDKTARMWNVKTGAEIKRFVGHSETVRSVAFFPDNRRILTASEDRTARIWSVDTGLVTQRFGGELTDGFAPIVSAAVSPDGSTVLTDPTLGGSTLWSVETGQLLRRFEPDSNEPGDHGVFTPSQSVFSPDGRRALTVSFDMTARLWNVQTGKQLSLFESSSTAVGAAVVSPDGQRILTGSSDGVARLWDIETGQELRHFEGAETQEGHMRDVKSLAFSSDGRRILTGSYDGTSRVWNVETGRQLQEFDFHDPVNAVAFSPDGNSALVAGYNSTVRLWDTKTTNELGHFASDTKDNIVASIAFSPNGKSILIGTWDLTLWDADKGQKLQTIQRLPVIPSSVAFSPTGELVIAGLSAPDNTVRIWNVKSGKELPRLKAHIGSINSVTFSPDGKMIATASGDNTALLWDLETEKVIKRFQGHSGPVTSAQLLPKADILLTSSEDGTTRFWNVSTSKEIVRLVSYSGGGWTAADASGRFDTGDLDGGSPLHWSVSDDLLHPLPLEIFMRDYYEPKLLPRLLSCHRAEEQDPGACKKEFRPVRSLANLNRVQPLVEVEKAEWADAANGLARVTVKVSRNKESFPRDGKQVEISTGVYDLRLFRDGQLVGWEPKASVDWQLEPPPTGPKADELDLARWREKTEVPLDSDGIKHISFLVQVPRRTDLKQVAFSAYAFNEDRVKSATASATLTVDKPLTARAGKAYLISVGVNRTESSPRWDLQYAANDARSMSRVVGDKLEGTKQFADVVRIRLVSDAPDKQEAGEAAATRAHLQAVLDVLAGRRRVSDELKKEIPGIERAEKAQPEDLVLLSFSSHGYTDVRGVFHIVLSDIGKDTPQDKITAELQRNSLSSDVLSGWLRGVDAGEMTMIVDACHSEATVAAEGFKPGPMGSRGLGQLAYDKGMRILAASKSNEEAMELGGDIKQGLLSYALVEEGLVEGKAAKDGKVLMAGWLTYGEQEVPNLYNAGEVKGLKGEQPIAPNGRDIIYLGHDQASQAYQQPVLFDFNKQKTDTLLSTR